MTVAGDEQNVLGTRVPPGTLHLKMLQHCPVDQLHVSYICSMHAAATHHVGGLDGAGPAAAARMGQEL